VNDSKRRVDALWSTPRALIGMIHLPPLPGAPRWTGPMKRVLRRALEDATALEAAGFDGVIVENYLDAPFHPATVPAVTVAAMTRAVAAVVEQVRIPVGVNVLRNDAAAALSIAAATGAAFIRVNVHTGAMWTDQGLVTGTAHETLRLRRELGLDTAIFADVHVKHATPPAGADLGEAAADAWSRGLADALVVSGSGTGRATEERDVDEVGRAVPEAPVFIGSGVTADSVGRLPAGARGAIVGTAVMRYGVAGGGVDPELASAFIQAAADRK